MIVANPDLEPEMPSPAAAVIAVFGGTSAMARALGVPISTVHSWKRAGVIPAKHQPKVLEAAQRLGLPITPASFFAGAGGQAAEEAA